MRTTRPLGALSCRPPFTDGHDHLPHTSCTLEEYAAFSGPEARGIRKVGWPPSQGGYAKWDGRRGKGGTLPGHRRERREADRTGRRTWTGGVSVTDRRRWQ